MGTARRLLCCKGHRAHVAVAMPAKAAFDYLKNEGAQLGGASHGDTFPFGFGLGFCVPPEMPVPLLPDL